MRKEKAMNGPKRKCEADDEEEELNETRKRARLVFRSRPKNLVPLIDSLSLNSAFDLDTFKRTRASQRFFWFNWMETQMRVMRESEKQLHIFPHF